MWNSLSGNTPNGSSHRSGPVGVEASPLGRRAPYLPCRTAIPRGGTAHSHDFVLAAVRRGRTNFGRIRGNTGPSGTARRDAATSWQRLEHASGVCLSGFDRPADLV